MGIWETSTGLVDDFEILEIEDEFEQDLTLKLLVKNLDVDSYNANPYEPVCP